MSKQTDRSGIREASGEAAAVGRELTCCYVKEMISFAQEARGTWGMGESEKEITEEKGRARRLQKRRTQREEQDRRDGYEEQDQEAKKCWERTEREVRARGENQQTEMKSKNEGGRGRDGRRRTKGEREWEVCEKENDEGGEVGVEREGSGRICRHES